MHGTGIDVVLQCGLSILHRPLGTTVICIKMEGKGRKLRGQEAAAGAVCPIILVRYAPVGLDTQHSTTPKPSPGSPKIADRA